MGTVTTIDVHADIDGIVNNITPVTDGDTGINTNYKDCDAYIQYVVNDVSQGSNGTVSVKKGDNIVYNLFDNSQNNKANYTDLTWFEGAEPDTGSKQLLELKSISGSTMTMKAKKKGTENYYLNFSFKNISTNTTCAAIWDPKVIIGGQPD